MGAVLALAFLGVVAAGTAGAALYFGFIPGPSSWLAGGSAADSTVLRDSSLTVDTLGGVPLTDSTAATPVADTSSVSTAPDGPVSVADSAAGDALYHGAGRCVGCHGAVGEGAPGLGPSLRTPRDASVAGLTRVITAGAPPTAQFRIAMPSYGGQLASDDIVRVAAYVHAVARPGSTAPDSAAAAPAGAVNADAQPVRPTVPRP